MDIKDLDKKQLILLTLLITFVVSIATGIVTVSLMKQMPKSVPQTINNVIQRTIERVTTVDAPVKETTPSPNTGETNLALGDGDVVVSIYPSDQNLSVSSSPAVVTPVTGSTLNESPASPKELGQGIIISDVGLILVDSTILTDSQVYKVVLNKTDFVATVLKKYNNGFTVLKISKNKTDAKNTDATVAPTKI